MSPSEVTQIPLKKQRARASTQHHGACKRCHQPLSGLQFSLAASPAAEAQPPTHSRNASPWPWPQLFPPWVERYSSLPLNCHTLTGALLQYPQMPASLTLITDQSSHMFTWLTFPKDWFCQPLIVFVSLKAGEVCEWEGCLMDFHSSFQKAIMLPAFGFLSHSLFFC